MSRRGHLGPVGELAHAAAAHDEQLDEGLLALVYLSTTRRSGRGLLAAWTAWRRQARRVAATGAAVAGAYRRATGITPEYFPINHKDPFPFEPKPVVPPIPQSPTNGLQFTF